MDTSRWATSYTLWQRSKRSLVGGVSTSMRAAALPHPLFFERASGAYQWDVDGHCLTDYVLGWGAIILGHCHPAVVSAVTDQVARGETFGAQHALEYQVAERILPWFPFAERVLYSNTGTEAVQMALRLARAATGRRKFVKFVGHYHGWADSVLVSYRPPPSEANVPRLESLGQVPSALSDVLVCPWNDPEAIRQVFAEHGEDIAAVLTEPVLCNSGVVPPIAGYLQMLRDFATKSGSVLIFDEVITGFRTGVSGATGRYGVAPDLVVLGKAVANGYPVSLVVGRTDIMELANGRGVVHAGTFNGNPIVLRAALATLEVLDRPETLSTLFNATDALASGLITIFKHYGIPAQIPHVGGVAQILLGRANPPRDYQDFARADQATYNLLLVECLKRNVYLLPGGRLYVSAAHSSEDITRTLDAFDQSMHVLQQGKGGISVGHAGA